MHVSLCATSMSCAVMYGFIFQVVLLSLTENTALQPKFQLVEYFAGDGAVSKVFQEAGKATFKFDVKYSARGMNMLGHGGFATLDYMVYVPLLEVQSACV